MTHNSLTESKEQRGIISLHFQDVQFSIVTWQARRDTKQSEKRRTKILLNGRQKEPTASGNLCYFDHNHWEWLASMLHCTCLPCVPESVICLWLFEACYSLFFFFFLLDWTAFLLFSMYLTVLIHVMDKTEAGQEAAKKVRKRSSEKCFFFSLFWLMETQTDHCVVDSRKKIIQSIRKWNFLFKPPQLVSLRAFFIPAVYPHSCSEHNFLSLARCL